ncbi:MAG: zinc ribbon domain-containing protein [Bacteroidales bacterium]|nr:zinc ribbon domain-containing protein [Bacteroidales bacterium]
MSNDFTRYPFDFKTIRVIEDTKDKNHKYVIEDVMCIFFDNGHNYWEGLKHQLSAAGLRQPSAYTTCKTEKGTIDVATRWQLLQIISYIPHRKAKKDMVKIWLENNSKTKKQIIETPKKQIIEKPKEQKKEKPIHSDSDFDTIERNGAIIFASFTFLGIVFVFWTGLPVLFVLIFVLGIFITFAHLEYNCGVGNDFFESRQINKAKNTHYKLPKQISNKISSIFSRRLMTYKERVEIVNEAVNLGVKLNYIQTHLNNKLKSNISLYRNVDLTRCVKCREKIPEELEQCPFCGKMQIWPELHKLSALALSDRVLTDLERHTIANKAIRNGISSEEINQYLDDQLNLRLKSYTKVDLRDCPYCGAQIPLISDECMYCGKPLEHIEGSTNIAFNISGKEADIIRSENQRVEQERHGITNCPDCGAPFPLISNICESCGHVLHERTENALNIKNLLTNMQRSIDRVNKAPKPTVLQIIMYWFYYILMILSIFAFIVGIIAESEVGKIISLTGFIGGIIAMGTNAVLNDTKSPVLIADGEYYKAKHSYEMFAREVDTLYGDDDEAQKMLSNFSSTLKLLKRERYQNRIKVGRIILITALVILGVVTYFSVKAEDYTQPHKENKEITIPPNTEWALNFSKHLEPYPPESGVQDNLSDFLRANKGAELSFVMGEDNNQPVFHWKVAQLELLPGESADTNHIFKNVEIGIQLLDSNCQQIKTLSICLASRMPYHNYNTIIDKGEGHYYIDFWSKNYTSEESILYTISEKAVYYTIYYNTKHSNY